MGRNVGSHTYGDTDTAVYKKIWETRGQNGRLLKLIVVVGAEINGVLVYILEHFVGDFCQSCFCITVCGRRIAVDRAEVTVTVHHRVAKREVLG